MLSVYLRDRSFIGQIPLVVVCFLLAGYRLPQRTQKEGSDCDVSRGSAIHDIDFLGIMTFAATVVSFLLLLHVAGAKGEQNSTQIYYLAAAFAIFGACFLLIEQFWAPRPVIPLSLLTQGVGGYCLVQILLLGARFGVRPEVPVRSMGYIC